MQKQNFTRQEVIEIIELMRNDPDTFIESVTNEDTHTDSEMLLENYE